jgi:uncharacterized protein YyaL (SSP411 family)
MAHESFEDADTAALMNAHYINIKVDREERPDLDKIYQNAHSMLTGRPGGWPLTVFLTPDDHMPIFAGTYFPAVQRHGLPSFRQVLEGISRTWETRRSEIDRQSESLREAFDRISTEPANGDIRLSAIPLDTARNQIEAQFDARYGGFSAAPKFPHPAILRRALTHWAATGRGSERLLHTAVFTLEQMADGGIFDHLGGGFYRYSTDEKWMIPHFEKMLYDNGPLLELFSAAGVITGNTAFVDSARLTADWVMREMQSADGGYYSSLDADSEGEEGRFYVWTRAEIADHLGEDELPLFSRRYGLDRPANFEGRWHLHAHQDCATLAEAFNISEDAVRAQLRRMADRLFEVREQRVHPERDDKVLTAWNGLMIQGMAGAGRLLQKEAYIESAASAASFVQQHLWRNGRLLATCKDGRSHLNAYLDDYAFMLAGLLELLQARWQSEWLEWAITLADRIIELFEDGESGGYFFTSHDHEKLILRSKSYADEAIPAGSGIAALALQRLGYLIAEPRYLESTEKCLKAAWQGINQAAISHCTMLDALHEHLQPPRMIILRGNANDLAQWLSLSRGRFLSETHIYAIEDTAELPSQLADKSAADKPRAYLCRGLQCEAPLESLPEWQELIESIEQKP